MSKISKYEVINMVEGSITMMLSDIESNEIIPKNDAMCLFKLLNKSIADNQFITGKLDVRLIPEKGINKNQVTTLIMNEIAYNIRNKFAFNKEEISKEITNIGVNISSLSMQSSNKESKSKNQESKVVKSQTNQETKEESKSKAINNETKEVKPQTNQETKEDEAVVNTNETVITEEQKETDIKKLGTIDEPSKEGFIEILIDNYKERLSEEQKEAAYDMYLECLAHECEFNSTEEDSRKVALDKTLNKIYTEGITENVELISINDIKNDFKEATGRFKNILNKYGFGCKYQKVRELLDDYKNIVESNDFKYIDAFKQVVDSIDLDKNKESIMKVKPIPVILTEPKEVEIIGNDEITVVEEQKEEIKPEAIIEENNNESLVTEHDDESVENVIELHPENCKLTYNKLNFDDETVGNWKNYFIVDNDYNRSIVEAKKYLSTKSDKYILAFGDGNNRSANYLGGRLVDIDSALKVLNMNLSDDATMELNDNITTCVGLAIKDYIANDKLKHKELKHLCKALTTFENIVVGLA